MTDDHENAPAPSRTTIGGWTMLAGLGASYGFLAWIAGRFLYPAHARPTRWLFVTRVRRMAAGQAMAFRTPAGANVTVARRGRGDSVDDFVALSSTCPHLGCQVQWEAQRGRFFCPCHNGAFDPSGKPIAGPPAAAGTPLSRYPLKIDGGLLYIEVPVESTARADTALEPIEPVACTGPGVDPCLYPREDAGRSA